MTTLAQLEKQKFQEFYLGSNLTINEARLTFRLQHTHDDVSGFNKVYEFEPHYISSEGYYMTLEDGDKLLSIHQETQYDEYPYVDVHGVDYSYWRKVE